MARKRTKSDRKFKRNNAQAILSSSVARIDASDASRSIPCTSTATEQEPKRFKYTAPMLSPRSRHMPDSLSNGWDKSDEHKLALVRNRHTLLPQNFEIKRVERWLNESDENRLQWAYKYLKKAFLGFPIPVELTSNKEIVSHWFNLPDVSGAAKTKLFGRMTNAWNQKVKRAKRKSDGIRSVELSSIRMKELRLIAKDAEITV